MLLLVGWGETEFLYASPLLMNALVSLETVVLLSGMSHTWLFQRRG
jgi:hypothetical protein